MLIAKNIMALVIDNYSWNVGTTEQKVLRLFRFLQIHAYLFSQFFMDCAVAIFTLFFVCT